MIRNFKALGLTLVATFAMAALVASGASADFRSEVHHTTVTGTQGVTNTLTVAAGTLHCTTATFEGTSTETTSSSSTVAPNYQGCKITNYGLETVNAIVDMNGCHYLLTTTGQVHLECNTGLGSAIEVTAPLCVITFHPQTISSVDYQNMGSGTTREVKLTWTATGVNYTQTGVCPGGTGGFSNGTASGSILFTGEDTNGNHVGIWHEAGTWP